MDVLRTCASRQDSETDDGVTTSAGTIFPVWRLWTRCGRGD
ncbi:hypothetical protein E2C01_072839 [Portunus trituberculatus]|uniref:Uncharacterized protein n=1 Tax=Portunus trituberculatus TaxID=210409 RepID=A0A5B7I887_PORTR|nr:hypothetical protein [Portunus trituberculatus]